MSEETPAVEELEVGVGDKKLRLRGSDLLTSVIGMIVCSGLLLLWFVLSDHRTDAKESTAALILTLKEMTAIQKENVTANRVMNCLIATEQKDRELKLPTCERLAK